MSFGLPTETVYATVIDKENYVWICTDNGVIKYNGSHLKLFTTRNGLPSNDIFNIYVDAQNRKWLMGFFGGIYYIKNDKVYKIPGSNFINDTKSIFEDNNILYLTGTDKTYKLFLSSGKFKELKSVTGTMVVAVNRKDKTIFGIGQNRYVKICNFVKDQVNVEFDMNQKRLYPTKQRIFNNIVFFDSINKKKQIYENQKWVDIHKVLNIEDEDFKDLSRGIASDKYILFDKTIKLFSNGKYQKNLSNAINKFELQKNEVENIDYDNNGNFWVTFNNVTGFFLPRNFDNIVNYSFLKESIKINKTVNFVSFNKNYALFFTEDLHAHVFDLNTCKTIYTSPNIISLGVPMSAFVYNNTQYICSTEGITGYKFENNTLKETFRKQLYTKTLAIKNDTVYSIHGKWIYKNYTPFLLLNAKTRNRFIAINGDDIFIGNELEIMKYNIKNKSIIKNEVKFANSMIAYKDGILVGTNSKGITYYNKNLKPIATIDLKNECINTLSIDPNNNILAGSNKILYVIKNKNNTLEIINKISNAHGLVKGKIISIYTWNNKTFIATNKGISVIKKLSLKNNNKNAKIDIDYISSNDKIIKTLYNITIPRNKNEINFKTSLKGFNLNPEDFSKYYYLKKDNNQAKFSEYNEAIISFKDLLPGDYEFGLQLKNNETGKIIDTKKINFTVVPNFYEKPFFKLFLLLFALSIVFFGTRYYRNEKSKKLSLTNELLNIEMKTLKSQMNPHFIFNVLNTIQSSIYLKNEIETNKLFGVFSKLMRDTLDIINKDSITLIEEIDYLKNYIVLENIRKNKKIKIEFEIEENLDLEQKIPVMLIQPLIENIFIHAFDTTEQNPKITLRFYQRYDYVFIEVEDNGKGMLPKKDTEKKSYATKIIENRLKILNKINNQHNTISYFDLKDYEEGKSGTLVKLILATM